jgi:hypothetical protein
VIVRYAVATHERHAHEVSYRYYITELIRQYAQGKTFSESFYDRMHPAEQVTRTVEEIVADVTRRAGLEVIE